jgi:hypothetical protein
MRMIGQQEEATWTPHGLRCEGIGGDARPDNADPVPSAFGDAATTPAQGRLGRWLDTARAWPSHSVQAVFGLLHPPLCAACGASTGPAHGLCERCWSGFSLIERPCCERLGTPFALDLGVALIVPAATADPPVFHAPAPSAAMTRPQGRWCTG